MPTSTEQNSAAAVSPTPPLSQIALVVLDMAGTTVADDGLVVRAFDAAASAVGLAAIGPEREDARQYVLDTMGQSKIEVFRALFGTDGRAEEANRAFEAAYDDLVADGVTPIPGAANTIGLLREAGVKVALTTGFSSSTQRRILDALRWHNVADAVLAPGDGVRGRPHPDLVLTAALRTNVDDAAAVAVVGDTTSDIVSGCRAGASIVAGVLTGAHDADALRGAGATHILASVADLPGLILPA
ncbi:phosphonatase-like hydrolase [Rhodococcus jostii]|uniref:Phosphonatase-like hydrolase n=1 Tax=Rhodococcus jostii TaxID=132919 RepID=A0A1H5MJ14_RHOJO|nr:phosphonatase-like hydrolase [Rhodococcus jostii]SEE89100.1 phosphonatase-like hydrolase [Rhodococcus jostii]